MVAYSDYTRYTDPSMSRHPIRKQLTIRFLHRTVLFVFSFLLALTVLFILGNIQNFLDSSQLIILKALIVIGVLLFLLAFFSLVIEAYYAIRAQRPYYLIHCIISGIAIIFGLVIAVVSFIILLLSAGILPS